MRVAAAIWSTWILLVLSLIAVGPMLGLKSPETSPVMGLSGALVLTLAGALGRDGKMLARHFSSFLAYRNAYAQNNTFEQGDLGHTGENNDREN
jgi:hypothetical protein